jgi:hypothetical protein
MSARYKIQEWLADRFSSVQYPQRDLNTHNPYVNIQYREIPRGLPTTKFGILMSMFVLFGVLVVLIGIAIPVIYCVFWLFAAIFGFI